MARACAQEDERFAQGLFVLVGRGGRRESGLRPVLGGQPQQRLAFLVLEDARGHLGDVQHPVHHAGGQGAARHPVVFGFLGILDNRQAAALLDALEADGPIAVRPGEHDGRGVWPVGVGQGAEEQVHGDALAAFGLQWGELEVAVDDGQVLARRDDVDAVRLQFLAVSRLGNRHHGRGLEDGGQRALVFGREVDDDHVGLARAGRQGLKERLERGDGAGGAAEGHDGHPLVAVGRDDVVDLVGVEFRHRVRADHGQTPVRAGGGGSFRFRRRVGFVHHDLSVERLTDPTTVGSHKPMLRFCKGGGCILSLPMDESPHPSWPLNQGRLSLPRTHDRPDGGHPPGGSASD